MRNSIIADERGTTAVEFALLLPAFVGLLLGGFCLSLLGFTLVNLHHAVETGARCAAVQTTVCTDATSTQNKAQSAFTGFGGTPTFTYTAAACGSQVTGTTTFTLDTGLTTISVPLSATACYP